MVQGSYIKNVQVGRAWKVGKGEGVAKNQLG